MPKFCHECKETVRGFTRGDFQSRQSANGTESIFSGGFNEKTSKFAKYHRNESIDTTHTKVCVELRNMSVILDNHKSFTSFGIKVFYECIFSGYCFIHTSISIFVQRAVVSFVSTKNHNKLLIYVLNPKLICTNALCAYFNT